jgi:hypothetical protein
MPSKNFKSN